MVTSQPPPPTWGFGPRNRLTRVGYSDGMTLFRRSWIALLAVVALLGLGTGTAAAHVTVNPSETTSGSWAKLTFRVPNESATASTVSLSIALPTDHPFPNVSLMPVPGWTASTTTATLDPPVTEGNFTLDEATDSVSWTADDGVGVSPGEFMEFSISVGPVPSTSSLALPATQTYSDGTVVEWADIAAAGEDPHDLDHPAPVLTIAPSGHVDEAAHSLSDRSTTSDATAQLLGALGLALGFAALVVALFALKKKSRVSEN